MIKCKNCNTLNEKDAVFCKRCGLNLEIDSDYEYEQQYNNDNNKNKNKKTKNKVIKKVVKKKEKSKKDKKNRNKNKNKKDVIVKKEMSFGQSLFMLFLVIICIVLFGALAVAGYYIWQEQSIEVPNVTNMTFEDAELILAKSDLNAVKIEKETEDYNLNNIVLDQNKKEGKKVSKNSTIKLTVGLYKKYYILEDFTGMNVNSVISILKQNNIHYAVNYKTVSDQEGDIVLSESPKANTKLKSGDTVKLTVSKVKETKNIEEENQDTDEQTEKETSEESDETISEDTKE